MSKAAEEVKKLIDAIGEVTLKSEKKIQNARKAYDALTEEQKKLAAECRLEELKKADDGKKPVKTDDSMNIGLYLTLGISSVLAVAALIFCKLAEKRRKYYDQLRKSEQGNARLVRSPIRVLWKV